MAKVCSAISMSLDGFVTGPNDSREHQLGVGGEPLHAWFGDTDEDTEVLRKLAGEVGAIVMGRRSYDFCEGDGGWGEGGPAGDVPCFVVTHRVPDQPASPVFTFVTDGAASAIEQAKKVAGDKMVGLHGASVPKQALAAGLLDEIQVHLVPILLGGGVRLFDVFDGAAIELERDSVVATPLATHLRYRVVS